MADHFSYDVLLSHTSKDKLRVRRLARQRKRPALHVPFDEWIIKPGDIIKDSI